VPPWLAPRLLNVRSWLWQNCPRARISRRRHLKPAPWPWTVLLLICQRDLLGTLYINRLIFLWSCKTQLALSPTTQIPIIDFGRTASCSHRPSFYQGLREMVKFLESLVMLVREPRFLHSKNISLRSVVYLDHTVTDSSPGQKRALMKRSMREAWSKLFVIFRLFFFQRSY
jgi:hypothetical protein